MVLVAEHFWQKPLTAQMIHQSRLSRIFVELERDNDIRLQCSRELFHHNNSVTDEVSYTIDAREFTLAEPHEFVSCFKQSHKSGVKIHIKRVEIRLHALILAVRHENLLPEHCSPLDLSGVHFELRECSGYKIKVAHCLFTASFAAEIVSVRELLRLENVDGCSADCTSVSHDEFLLK